jgi:hypothetical protein
MKIFSRPCPGFLSGTLTAITVLILLTMRVRGDISLLAAAASIVLVLTLWFLANLVVRDLRSRNSKQSDHIQQLWRRIQQHNKLPVRIVPLDDRQDPHRIPQSVKLFWEKYPSYR